MGKKKKQKWAPEQESYVTSDDISAMMDRLYGEPEDNHALGESTLPQCVLDALNKNKEESTEEEEDIIDYPIDVDPEMDNGYWENNQEENIAEAISSTSKDFDGGEKVVPVGTWSVQDDDEDTEDEKVDTTTIIGDVFAKNQPDVMKKVSDKPKYELNRLCRFVVNDDFIGSVATSLMLDKIEDSMSFDSEVIGELIVLSFLYIETNLPPVSSISIDDFVDGLKMVKSYNKNRYIFIYTGDEVNCYNIYQKDRDEYIKVWSSIIEDVCDSDIHTVNAILSILGNIKKSGFYGATTSTERIAYAIAGNMIPADKFFETLYQDPDTVLWNEEDEPYQEDAIIKKSLYSNDTIIDKIKSLISVDDESIGVEHDRDPFLPENTDSEASKSSEKEEKEKSQGETNESSPGESVQEEVQTEEEISSEIYAEIGQAIDDEIKIIDSQYSEE